MSIVIIFKKCIKRAIWEIQMFNLRIKVIKECIHSRDPEKIQIAVFLLKPRKFPFFPYKFTDKYIEKNIAVYYDEDDYPYVIHNENRLYMKKDWDEKWIKRYYMSLQWDQDYESPHCYLLNKDRYPNEGDVIADVGAAEGIFTLNVIDIIDKAYLFEGDDEWEIPLKKTFSKWSQKVEIIKKYIGAEETDETISLDSYFEFKKVDVLKADIEGSEGKMLRGG